MPSLSALQPRRVIRALERCGLQVERQSGSHVALSKAGLKRPVIIAMHNRELSPATIKKILQQAQVSEEEFVKHA